jgi:hypothetical protein
VHVRMTVFSVPKDGNPDDDWEDKAVVRLRPDGSLRFLVLDGASEAFDTVRWVDQIAASYAPVDPNEVVPRLDRHEMGTWFSHLQRDWARHPPVLRAPWEERKYHETGSFATMLAGVVTDVDGPGPRWQAMALGDTVLFHVRAGALLAHFPRLTKADFGLRPAGISTKPDRLPAMMDGLATSQGGVLASGDILFVATDALAEWMLGRVEHDRTELFSLLAGLGHPDSFAALVAHRRAAREMVNDDMTLLRLTFSDHAPSRLVVCL